MTTIPERRKAVEERMEAVRASAAKHRNKAEKADNLAAELEKELRRLNLPAEPPADISVIYFVKTYGKGGASFHYAAVSWTGRVPSNPSQTYRRWAVTGKSGLTGVPWERLAEFITQDEPTPPKVLWMTPHLALYAGRMGGYVD